MERELTDNTEVKHTSDNFMNACVTQMSKSKLTRLFAMASTRCRACDVLTNL